LASGWPFAELTADQIASKAVADLKAASSFRVAGSASESGQTYTLDIAYGTRNCRGAVALSGEGSIVLLKKGNKVWLKPDNRFWRYIAGSSAPDVLNILAGKYLAPSKSTNLNSFTSFCDRRDFTDAFDRGMTGMSKGKVTMISGRRALQIHNGMSTAYVTISAHPEFLRIIENNGRGHLNLTGYDLPVSVTAPPASMTLDGAKYGF
jgi:hypothetical protein